MVEVANQTVQTSGSIAGLFSIDLTISVTLNGVTYTYTEVTRKVNAVY